MKRRKSATKKKANSLPRCIKQISDDEDFSTMVSLPDSDDLASKQDGFSNAGFSSTRSNSNNNSTNTINNATNTAETAITIATEDTKMSSTSQLKICWAITLSVNIIVLILSSYSYHWTNDKPEVLAVHRKWEIGSGIILNYQIFVLTFGDLKWIPIGFGSLRWVPISFSKLINFINACCRCKPFIKGDFAFPVTTDEKGKKAFNMTKLLSLLVTIALWLLVCLYENDKTKTFEDYNFERTVYLSWLGRKVKLNRIVFVIHQQFWYIITYFIVSVYKNSFSCFYESFSIKFREWVMYFVCVCYIIRLGIYLVLSNCFQIVQKWSCVPNEYISVLNSSNKTESLSNIRLRSPFIYKHNDTTPCNEILSHEFRGLFNGHRSIDTAFNLLLVLTFILAFDPFKSHFKKNNVLHIPYLLLTFILTICVVDDSFNTRFNQLFG